MEQMRVILYSLPSGIAVGKRAGTTQGGYKSFSFLLDASGSLGSALLNGW
jgi:hypothetical protein